MEDSCFNSACLKFSDLFHDGNLTPVQTQLIDICIILVIGSAIMFQLAWYLEEVLPKEWGTQREWVAILTYISGSV